MARTLSDTGWYAISFAARHIGCSAMLLANSHKEIEIATKSCHYAETELSGWERVKKAFANDWEQTKADFGSERPRDVDQDVDDTVYPARLRLSVQQLIAQSGSGAEPHR